MANWNLPTITSGYINFVDEMNAKFTDAATLQFGSPINLPLQTIRWNRSFNTFQEWLGPVLGWQDKILGIAGGGTGAATAGDIRVNLGLGSMSTQNNNAVNITGGTITGVSLDITATTGILPLARGGTGASLSLSVAGSVLGSFDGSVQFMNGQNIAQLYAGSLVSGTVPLARLSGVGFLNGANVWNATNVFTQIENNIILEASYAILSMNSLVGTLNKKKIRLLNYGGDFHIQKRNDDDTGLVTLLTVLNDGTMQGNGSGLINLSGSNIATGLINPARLGSGAPSSATYLRGDGVWATIATGGEVSPIPSGMIAIFSTGCPSGWTRVTGMDNRFILGSPNWGLTGGTNTHSHQFDVTSGSNGGHSHSFGGNFGGSGSGTGSAYGRTGGPISLGGIDFDPGDTHRDVSYYHEHDLNVPVNVNVNVTTNVTGDTSGVGDHAHRVAGGTNGADNTPPYFSVVFCMKN